jgi:hypothetical protein
MEHSPSRVANSCSASQEILRFLSNHKVPYREAQMNRDHTFTMYSLNMHINIILSSTLRSTIRPRPFGISS